MNRAQRRKAPKILADKVGGKKKLAAMLEEAKARAREADAAKHKEQSGRDGITLAPPTKTKPPQDGVELFGAGTVLGEGLRGVPVAMVAESDFDADADKERAGHGVENPNMLRVCDVTLSIGGKEVSGPPAHFQSESDFDADEE